MNHRPLSTLFIVSTLAFVTACAGPYRREERREDRREDRRELSVAPIPATQFGSVNNIEIVPVATHDNAGGAILGAVIGGVIGNQFGGGIGKAAATGAGVVGGAIVGNAVQNRNRRDDEIYRVSVRFEDGSQRAFDFQRVDDLRVGDRVKFEEGQLHRV